MAKKKKNNVKISNIILRYLILLVVALPNLWIFYKILTPLTVWPISWVLGLFFDTTILAGNIILLNQTFPVELIPACIAGSAYYLLFILNLSTPNIKLSQRVKMISLAFLAFLIINIIRIVILSFLAFSGSASFDITHKVFWYLLSTIFVVGIWFIQVKIYQIRKIPFYSDFISIKRSMK